MNSKQNKASNQYANDPRSIELREWCNANLGRGRRLEDRVLGFTGISHYKYGKNKISDDLWKQFSAEMKNIEYYEKVKGVKLRPNLRDSSYEHSLEPLIYCEAKQHLARADNLSIFNKFASSSITLENMSDHREFVIEHYPLYKSTFLEIDGETTVPSKKIQDELEQWFTNDEELKRVKGRLANFVYGYNFRKSDYASACVFSTIISNINSGKNVRVTTYEKIKKVMNKVDSMIESNHPFAIAAKKL